MVHWGISLFQGVSYKFNQMCWGRVWELDKALGAPGMEDLILDQGGKEVSLELKMGFEIPATTRGCSDGELIAPV